MEAAEIIDAIAGLAWPVMVAIVLLKLAPTLSEILRGRDVTVRGPGDMEISVAGKPLTPQEAVDAQRKQTEVLRTDLSRLAAVVAELHEPTLGPRLRDAAAHTRRRAREALQRRCVRRLLWVDDRPANNAYEIAVLNDHQIDVVEARTTAEGLRALEHDGPFDALITDMHREERGRVHETAGLDLLRALRESALHVPAFVYCAPGSIARYADDIYAAGALGATTDPTELLELLGVNPGPLFHARVEREVHQLLDAIGPTVADGRAGQLDFTVEHDGRMVGVVVKTWNPLADRPPRLAAALDAAAPGDDVAELWVVCGQPVDETELRHELDGRPVRWLTLDDLRQTARAAATADQGRAERLCTRASSVRSSARSSGR